jgi:hypothetical protein
VTTAPHAETETAVQPSSIPRAVPPHVPPAHPRPTLGPVAYQPPARWHQLLPGRLRNLMADWGWWQNPVPLRPSQHLMQVIDVLEQYGWCQSLDYSPTGRMCIRGAQKFLLHTGHATPAAVKQAVAYMQQTLHEHGFHQPFFAWNDLEERDFQQVKALITAAAQTAHANGE